MNAEKQIMSEEVDDFFGWGRGGVSVFINGLSFSLCLQVFSNLDEMISHHKHNQLLLIDSKSQAKHRAYLTHPAHP